MERLSSPAHTHEPLDTVLVATSASSTPSGVIFVTTPPEVRETKPHPASRRQFAVVLEVQAEIVTTDGDMRTFSPGMVAPSETWMDGAASRTS